MISQLIAVLDPVTGITVGNAYGLAEMQADGQKLFPAVYAGGDDFTKPTTDAGGTWSYWRVISQDQQAFDTLSTCMGIKATYRLRWVAMLDREGPCADISSALLGASSSLRQASGAIKTALAVGNARIMRVVPNQQSTEVYQTELGRAGMGPVPTARMMASIDVDVELFGDEDCFTGCATLTSVTPGTKCEIIQGMNVPDIWECMTDEQQDEMCEDNCGGGGCLVDVEVYFNGVLIDTLNDLDPCEAQTINIS